MRLLKMPTIALAALALTLLAGCIDYSEGLFASIEREEKIPESNLPKESSVFGMIKADGKYFVSLGKIYQRAVASNDWDSIGPPSGFGDSLAIDIVDVGGTAYVAYNDYELGGAGVFELSTASNSWASGNLYTGGKQITDLFALDGNLYAAVLDSGYTYDLLHYSGAGTAWTTVVDNNSRIVAGAYVASAFPNIGVGSFVFLSRGGRLHIGANATDGALNTAVLPSTIDAAFQDNEDFGGILYVADPDGGGPLTDQLYITSRKGHIYYSGGPSWTKGLIDDERPFTGMVWFDQLDGGIGGIVVGVQDLQSPERETEEGGYYELPNGGVDDITEPEGNGYDTTEMSDTTVIGFFVDPTTTPNYLFVLTYGQGLWRGEYGNSSGALFPDPEWTHE